MASVYDDPKVDPPMIDLAVVGEVGDVLRLSVTVGGQLQRYTLKRNVARTLLKELVDALT